MLSLISKMILAIAVMIVAVAFTVVSLLGVKFGHAMLIIIPSLLLIVPTYANQIRMQFKYGKRFASITGLQDLFFLRLSTKLGKYIALLHLSIFPLLAFSTAGTLMVKNDNVLLAVIFYSLAIAFSFLIYLLLVKLGQLTDREPSQPS